jgi:hypothetical protein
MRSLFAWTLAAVLCASVTHAQSKDDAEPPVTDEATASARSHFKLGVDFYRERNFRAALIEFERAYADSPHYKLLYNLGQASLELQEYANAIDYLSRYLAEGGSEISDERTAEVKQTIKYLESRIAYVTISTNEVGVEIYVDDSLVGKSPMIEPVRVGAGRHKFSAVREDGQPVERRIDVAAGDKREVRLDFAPAPSGVTVQAVQPLDNYTDDEPSDGDDAYTAAIAMSFTTGVLFAGAVTMTVLTGAAQQKYQEELLVPTSRGRLTDLRDDAETKALVTDIVWGATIASGAVTAVLFVLSGNEKKSTATRSSEGLAVGLGAGSLHLDARF